MVRGLCILLTLAVLLVPCAGAEADEGGWTLRLLPSRVVAEPADGEVFVDPERFAKMVVAPHYTLDGPVVRVVVVRPKQKFRPQDVRIQQPIHFSDDGLPKPLRGVTWRRIPASLVLERTRVEPFAPSMKPAPNDVADVLVQHRLKTTNRIELVGVKGAEKQVMHRLFVDTDKQVEVGIYADAGAHPNAVRAAAAACMAANLRVRPLTKGQINDGSFAKKIRCLLMPGGWAAHYVRDIDAEGREYIRRFIKTGGGYVGVCAGAYFACATVQWDGTDLDYPLDLVACKAVGPVAAIAPWPKHAVTGIEIDARSTLGQGLGGKRQAFYLGGCAFDFGAKPPSRATVLARYTAGGAPAVVTLTHGRGKVFLTGPHLEYDLTSDRDDLTWPERLGGIEDTESDWDVFQRGVRYAAGLRWRK